MAQHIMGAHDALQQLELHLSVISNGGVIVGLLVEAKGFIVLPFHSAGVTLRHQLLGGERLCCSNKSKG